MKLLAERQKLIKIADRSEYGWGVVAEYTADELADGSDDEKRLEKAEKATERKALKYKRKRVEPSPKPARSRVNSGQVPPLLATTLSAVAAKRPASVLDTIEGGYVLPLMSQPTPFSRRNYKSTSLHAEFVQQSVADLLAGNCIKEVPGEPFIYSPLSVVESSGGKKRLVINLRHLNKFLWKQKFKYEDLRVAMLLFERGDYLISFDLKSGYHHVDIVSDSGPFGGSVWLSQLVAG